MGPKPNVFINSRWEWILCYEPATIDKLSAVLKARGIPESPGKSGRENQSSVSQGRGSMSLGAPRSRFSRRNLLKAGLGAAISQVANPFVLRSRAAESVKIGLADPLTGPYAGLGRNELVGCELAVEQINAKDGILGRKVELVVEDSSSGDASVAVQKARKLIDSDKVAFLLGNVNSALSLAMAQVSNEKRILHVVPGAHTDAITGSSCHWNVFRVCNPTQTLASAVAGTLITNYGKNWYYITPDYAYGHTLEAGMVRAAAAFGGSRVGGDLTPLGTIDFSSYLIKAQAANPDVVIFLTQGDDMVNALKQAVQFGLEKKLHLAGAEQSLEALESLPPEARIGTWVMEWYWRQPGVDYVAEFADAIKKRSGRAPTARTWLGFVAAWTCALAANNAKSLDAAQTAKALQGFELPPEVGLMPNAPFYRPGQNQLIPTLYVGDARATGEAPDDYFKVTRVVRGVDVAGTVEDSGCTMKWPD
jgi:branched-chain amino acid transport system substrate-binding protein